VFIRVYSCLFGCCVIAFHRPTHTLSRAPQCFLARHRLIPLCLASLAADDPLPIIEEFLKSLEQQPSAQTELRQELEKWLHHLESQGRYNDDRRFVTLWMRYVRVSLSIYIICHIESNHSLTHSLVYRCAQAALLPAPTEVFHYLNDKNIGCKQALLYITWGFQLANERLFDEANDKFQLGINRYAQLLANGIEATSEAHVFMCVCMCVCR